MNNKFSVIAAVVAGLLMVAGLLVIVGFGVSFIVVDPVLVNVAGAVALVGTVGLLVVMAERVWREF